MKKLVRVTLYVVGGVLTLYSALIVYSIRTAGSDEGRFVATKNDLPTYVAGRWDWKGRQRPCTDSAHVITFGPGAHRTDWAPWNYTREVVRCAEKGVADDVVAQLPGAPAR